MISVIDNIEKNKQHIALAKPFCEYCTVYRFLFLWKFNSEKGH